MTRRCSHCNSNGHTIRTCSTKRGSGSGGGLRLFGVRLTDGSFKKSASMGSLSRPTPTVDSLDGYHSDDADRVLAALRLPITRIRKRGIPWTENEHRQFLLGLEKCGKGHWLAISQGYVPSRTPSQVASHAQKYFIRQTNPTAPERRRPSLFDIKQDMN